jgi:hypothetical protein
MGIFLLNPYIIYDTYGRESAPLFWLCILWNFCETWNGCSCYAQVVVKNPGPESPALGYPWKGVVYIAIFLREYWSAGVMEY